MLEFMIIISSMLIGIAAGLSVGRATESPGIAAVTAFIVTLFLQLMWTAVLQ